MRASARSIATITQRQLDHQHYVNTLKERATIPEGHKAFDQKFCNISSSLWVFFVRPSSVSASLTPVHVRPVGGRTVQQESQGGQADLPAAVHWLGRGRRRGGCMGLLARQVPAHAFELASRSGAARGAHVRTHAHTHGSNGNTSTRHTHIDTHTHTHTI